MTMLGAIADDVTGAADLCNMLVREGMRAVQTIGPARDLDLPESDAVVVALKSRTAPVDVAVRSSRDALAWLRELGARQFFFKYCSTFDSTPAGNIGPVADALLDDLEAEIAVVCPAYPANGRTVYQGHLFVGDRLLSESSMARHPLTPMTDANLLHVLGRQTRRRVGLVPLTTVRDGVGAIEQAIGDLRSAGSSYAVVDAVEDDDLRAIGAACRDMPILTGGAGLAIGLPRNFGFSPTAGLLAADDLSGPAIVLAGSSSEATIEQVRRMAERYPAVKVSALDAGGAAADAAVARLLDGPVLVYASADPGEVADVQRKLGASHAGEVVESRLAAVARDAVAAGTRRLVVAGGETSAAIVDAIGVRALAVGREIAPGVPWMISIGEPTVAIALKSGNFGAPDFFLDAVA
jgi:3-dehydrotetronate 4-kinase